MLLLSVIFVNLIKYTPAGVVESAAIFTSRPVVPRSAAKELV